MSLKSSYRASPTSLRPTYTAGPTALTPDGLYLLTTLHSTGVYITHLASSRVVARIKGDGTPITAIAVAPNTDPEGGEWLILTAHQSLSVRYYPFSTTTAADYLSLQETQPPFLTFTRQLTRAQTHQSPTLSLSVSPPVPGSDATLFATGSADGTVKVWDTKGGFVTHVFRGHGGGVSAFSWRFHTTTPNGSTMETSYANAPSNDGRIMQLLTGSVDTRVRVYDLLSPSAGAGKPVHVLEGHVSVVRGLDVAGEGRWLVSAGRDRVVLVWDLEAADKKGKKAPKVVQTLLASESLETVGFVSGTHGIQGVEQGRMVCYTGGERGRVRLWDVLKGSEVAVVPGLEVDEEPEEDEQRGLAYVL